MTNCGRSMVISAPEKAKKPPLVITPLGNSFLPSQDKLQTVEDVSIQSLASSAPSEGNSDITPKSPPTYAKKVAKWQECKFRLPSNLTSSYLTLKSRFTVLMKSPSPVALNTRGAKDERQKIRGSLICSTSKNVSANCIVNQNLSPESKATCSKQQHFPSGNIPELGRKDNSQNSLNVSKSNFNEENRKLIPELQSQKFTALCPSDPITYTSDNLVNTDEFLSSMEIKSIIPSVMHGRLPKDVLVRAREFIKRLPKPLIKDAHGTMGRRLEWLYGPYTYEYSGRSVAPTASFSECAELCESLVEALGLQMPNEMLLVHYPYGSSDLAQHLDEESAHASQQVLTFCIGAPATINLTTDSNEFITDFQTKDRDFYVFKDQDGFKHSVGQIPPRKKGRYAFTFRIFKSNNPKKPQIGSKNTRYNISLNIASKISNINVSSKSSKNRPNKTAFPSNIPNISRTGSPTKIIVNSGTVDAH